MPRLSDAGSQSGHKAPPAFQQPSRSIGALACLAKGAQEAPLLRLFCLLLAIAVLGGCQSAPVKPVAVAAPLVVRFFLETKPGEAGVPAQLPQSGVAIHIAPKPVFVEYDIANAEVAQVELGRCLMLQLTPAAARDLYRLSVAANSRRLVLSLNDSFLGARRIEQAMTDGVVLIFVELPDEALPGLVERIKRTSADIAAAAPKAKAG